MKELSLNVAKSLSKKLDIKDFKTILKKQQLAEAPVTTSHAEEIVYTSRELLKSSPSPEARRHGDMKGGGGAGGGYSSSDPNREFDFLIQSLRKDRIEQENEPFFEEGMENTDYRGSASVSGLTSPSRRLNRSKMTPNTASPTRQPKNLARSQSTGKISRFKGSSKSGGDLEEKSSSDNNNYAGSQNNPLTLILLRNEIHGLKEKINELNQKIQDLQAHQEFSNSVNQRSIAATIRNNSGSGNAGGNNPSMNAEVEKMDWRIALGEVSMNLRREISDKASREELYSVVRSENDGFQSRITVSLFHFILPLHLLLFHY